MTYDVTVRRDGAWAGSWSGISEEGALLVLHDLGVRDRGAVLHGREAVLRPDSPGERRTVSVTKTEERAR